MILGDGNHRAACEQLCGELGLRDRVAFKGFIPQEELKGYYRDTSVVTLSSVWPEPIATIGLEVMRYALPVVAFDAGGIRDWLRDGVNGYLVPWMDIDAYAARIDDLLRDKAKARQMGERGLEIVSREYDFDEYLTRLEDLFARVAGEPLHRKKWYLFSDEAAAMLVFSAPKVRPHCSLWQRHRSPGSVRFQAVGLAQAARPQLVTGLQP